MKLIPASLALFARIGLVPSLGLILFFFSGLLHAQSRTLLECPEGSPGDRTDRGFYIPNYPGTTLNSLTVYLKTANNPANTTFPYQVGIRIRSGSFNGPLLDQFRWANAQLNNTEEAVTIQFANVPVEPGSIVCFAFDINKQPAAPNLLYSVPGLQGGCPDVIQTNGTNPPLSTFRRNGVKLEITGEPYLAVDSGGPIQLAIDNANPGDTVTVAAGNYNESLTLRSGVDVQGAGADTTILTGTGTGSVVTANGISNMELSGLTVQGSGSNSLDAGLQIIESDIAVRNNTITGNTVGISTSDSNSFICSNRITGNGLPGVGIDHAIRCSGSDLFSGNRIFGNDGGVLVVGSSGSQFINNTVVENGWWGFQASNAETTVKNNIVSANASGGLFAENEAIIESTYNCLNQGPDPYAEVRGGLVSNRLGDRIANPEFDPAQPGAYFLSEGSPCIDAGDPAAIFHDLDGSRNDIGATGGACGSATPPGSILSGFVWTSVGNYANITGIAQSGTKRGLTTDRDRPFGGRPWLFGAFGNEEAVTAYSVKIAKWTGGTAPADGEFSYRSDPLSKTRFNISGGSLVAETVAIGPTYSLGGRPTYQLTRNSGNTFWAHENLRLILDTNSLDNGTYSVRIEGYGPILPGPVALDVNEDIIIRVNNTFPVARIDSVSFGGGAPFDECSIIDLPSSTSTLDFEITASHPDGFLDNYILDVLIGRNRSGGRISSDNYLNNPDPNASWTGVSGEAVAATPPSPEPALPGLQHWETCAYQFRLRAWARTTNGFGRIYSTSFFDNYAIDLEPTPVASPDLDGDGDVDGDDLQILAAALGED